MIELENNRIPSSHVSMIEHVANILDPAIRTTAEEKYSQVDHCFLEWTSTDGLKQSGGFSRRGTPADYARSTCEALRRLCRASTHGLVASYCVGWKTDGVETTAVGGGMTWEQFEELRDSKLYEAKEVMEGTE